MDSTIEVREDIVSDPLKHLLSLDWNSSITLAAIENNFDSSKSVKRVRFSDEVEKISYDSYEKNIDNLFSHDGICDERNNDIEMNAELSTDYNENQADIFIEETGFEEFDDVENSVESVVEDTNDSLPINSNSKINMALHKVQDFVNENKNQNNLLLLSNDQINHIQSSFDPEDETSNLNEVTHQVQNLSLENLSSINITLVSPVEPVSGSTNFDVYSIGNSRDKDELKSNINDTSTVTTKRRLKSKLYNHKQSWKLNSVLTENSSYSSASELNSAVFKAWCDVKNKTKSVQTSVSNEKNIMNKPTSNSAFLTWKKSKTDAQKKVKKDKTGSNFPSIHQEVSKNSKEEIDMVFKAWKKKKDEVLKQKMSEKIEKEQETVVDSLIEKKEKKLEADAAFNAWKQHKSFRLKIEKKKRAWVMQKKREEEERKVSRDKEALIVYHMWLESKSSVKLDTFNSVKAKPPWTPPGK